MNLSEFKEILAQLTQIEFKLSDGTTIPAHFHVTEVGQVDKRFIDCGGVIRHESVVNFQLWSADDVNHRLNPNKLLDIIRQSEDKLNISDAAIEVEYQSQTIGKYALDFDGKSFLLLNKNTACLAADSCGIPSEKQRKELINLATNATGCCTPNTGCC